MTNLREYYAAEVYIESSLIERKESIRRKKEIDMEIENLDYQASSPDEKALVEGCGKIGFLFVGEQDDKIMIKLQMNNNVSSRKISKVCFFFSKNSCFNYRELIRDKHLAVVSLSLKDYVF